MPGRAVVYAALILIVAGVLPRIRSPRARQLLLLIASYGLYVSWERWFAVILVASTLMNFLLGQWVARQRRPAALWTGIGLNVLLLSTFKYLPEIAASSSGSLWGRFSHIALPLGLSFWTFQAMSYLFDVYGGAEVDPTLTEFALYMAFFPVLIAGPICRLPDMLPQFRSLKRPVRGDFWQGLCRIATGTLMMLLGQIMGRGLQPGTGVSFGFDQITQWTGPDVWGLALGYGLQLFFDFAGYSHIAIGTAKILGFTIPENFNRPFLSTTPSIFWTRWHMSLSFWIHDYVYIPMAMVRASEWWWELSLLISMAVFGVWHKGAMTYLLFGCYHGLLLIGHRQVQQLRKRRKWTQKRSWGPLASWCVSIPLIVLGWVWFRANTVPQAVQMFRAVLSPGTYMDSFLPSRYYMMLAIFAAGYALTLLVSYNLDRYSSGEAAPRSEIIRVMARDRWVWVAPIYLFAMLAVLVLVNNVPRSGLGPFIYAGY